MNKLAPVPSAAIIDALKWRYATKQFDPSKKLSEADVATLLESLRLAASSFGLQPWKFYVVTSQSVKEQLVPVSWNQKQVADCSHMLVLTARKRIDPAYLEAYVDDIVATRGTPRESLKGMHDMILGFAEGHPQPLEWSKNQVYIALGTLLQTAALLNVDACPMEGIDKAAYDKILNVDPDYTTAVACPLGYRAEGDRYAQLKKVRFPAEKLFVHV
ncbi:MAG: NAD(P)H-dependent oxidoreductase [Tepidisphaeraceae bacterium]